MTKSPKQTSRLVEAATAFDEHLRAFQALVTSAGQAQLNSQRNIEKAALTATEAAKHQQQLGQLIGVFVEALNEAREENQRSTTLLEARGQEIRRRGDELTALRERMAVIAAQGAEISAAVRSVTADPGRRRAELVPELAEIESRMNASVDEATQLHEDSKSAGFTDVSSEVDSMRQQLQSARNKVKLLRTQILDTSSTN